VLRCVLGSEGCVLVPRSSGTSVATWAWPICWMTCVGSRVHLVGVSISFEKNFYRLPFTPPFLVRHIGLSSGIRAGSGLY
jgi:hypothetical protein